MCGLDVWGLWLHLEVARFMGVLMLHLHGFHVRFMYLYDSTQMERTRCSIVVRYGCWPPYVEPVTLIRPTTVYPHPEGPRVFHLEFELGLPLVSAIRFDLLVTFGISSRIASPQDLANVSIARWCYDDAVLQAEPDVCSPGLDSVHSLVSLCW